MSLVSTLYNATLKKTSTWVLVIIGSAFYVERGADVLRDTIYDYANKGVSYESKNQMYKQLIHFIWCTETMERHQAFV